MSAKKKKHAWIKCDQCSSVVSEKDMRNHDVYCSNIPCNNAPPCIKDSQLSCKLETFHSSCNEMAKVPMDCHGTLIMLTPGALSLCDIHIGDPVLIVVENKKYVRTAWKSVDKPVLSAAVFYKDPLASYSGHSVTVASLKSTVRVAKYVTVDFAETCDREKILKILTKQHLGRILAIGNSVPVEYFGVKVPCMITSIVSNSSSSETESDEFFKCTSSTVWITAESNQASIQADVPDLSGMESIMEEIDDLLKLSLSPDKSGIFRISGILFHGISGTGKTTVMRLSARKWCNSVIDFNELVGVSVAEKFKKLEQCIKHHDSSTPLIVTFDDIEYIASKSRGEHGGNFLMALSAIFDVLHHSGKPYAVMATTSQLNEISKSLRRPGRLDREIEVGVPNPLQRLKILQSLMKSTANDVPNDVLKNVADSAHGYVGADLVAVVTKALMSAIRSEKKAIEGEDLFHALSIIRPSAMREVTVQVPNVRWDDIGGQEELKHKLRQAVEWPLKHSESFQRLGIRPPRGVLMYGPPGCSKTMIAKALATESGLNFISVKGPELFSKWVGESEKAIREVFRRARQASPSIVFFDELDALAGERSSTSGGPQVQERVLAQLLTELDGVEALGHVIVVGATNRPDRIDPALLRPGRLDRVVHVPLPDLQTRQDIFRIQFRKTPVATYVDANELAKRTEGYSGAEVVAVCHEAALKALDEDMSSTTVAYSHFLHALEVVKPRTQEIATELF